MNKSSTGLESGPVEIYTKFITKSIGCYVRVRRSERKLSLRQFAKEVKISPTVLSDLENGTKTPRMETIIKLLHYLYIPYKKVFAEDVLPVEPYQNIPINNIKIRKILVEQGLAPRDIEEVIQFIDFKKYLNSKNK